MDKCNINDKSVKSSLDSPASHEVGQVVDQQFGQILVGRGVVGLADQNGRDLSPE